MSSPPLVSSAKPEFFDQIQTWLSNYQLKPENTFYYVQALTHNSYAHEHNLQYNYQRLELLGDAALNLVVCDFLFLNQATSDEGKITQQKANLVCAQTLGKVCWQINLHKLLRLGIGQQKMANPSSSKMWSDVYEAVVGAIYLDLGWLAAKSFVYKTLIKQAENYGFLSVAKNPKTLLQEKIAHHKTQTNGSRIQYKLVHKQKLAAPNPHEYRFHVQVLINNQVFATGSGYSMRKAEVQAAEKCLQKLND